MILRAPTENENAIATNPMDVMMSESEASAFQMESKNRFFGATEPQPNLRIIFRRDKGLKESPNAAFAASGGMRRRRPLTEAKPCSMKQALRKRRRRAWLTNSGRLT